MAGEECGPGQSVERVGYLAGVGGVVPHALAVTELAELTEGPEVEGVDPAWLLDRAATYLQARGNPWRARPLVNGVVLGVEQPVGAHLAQHLLAARGGSGSYACSTASTARHQSATASAIASSTALARSSAPMPHPSSSVPTRRTSRPGGAGPCIARC